MARTEVDAGEIGRLANEIKDCDFAKAFAIKFAEVRLPGPRLIDVLRQLNHKDRLDERHRRPDCQ